MIVNLICQEQNRGMLEAILTSNKILINDEASIVIIEDGMDFKGEYELSIHFKVAFIQMLINVIQGSDIDEFQKNLIFGKSGDTLVPVPFEEMTLINAQGNDTYINIGDMKQLKVKYKLYQLEEGILPNYFIRINKSEIVNMKKIKMITPMFKGNFIIYLEDHKLPYDISRNYIKGFKERLGIK